MDEVINSTKPYRLTRKDVLAFHFNVNLKKATLVSRMKLILGCGTLIGVVIGLTGTPLNEVVIFSLNWILLFAVFLFFILPFLSILTPSTKKLSDCEMIVKLFEDKVTATQDDNSSQYSWRNVDCIRQTKKRIFIYVTPICAFVIPKLSFETELALREFLETAERLLNQAKSAKTVAA